jgi:hypothetical protein
METNVETPNFLALQDSTFEIRLFKEATTYSTRRQIRGDKKLDVTNCNLIPPQIP